MPTYRPLRTSVVLMAAEVGPTVTLIPSQHSRHRKLAEYEAIDKAFTNGTQLAEKAVAPPSMSGAINFIGPAEQFPFLMVHAGADLFRPRAPERSSAVEKALAKLKAIRDAHSAGPATLDPGGTHCSRNASSPVTPLACSRIYDGKGLQIAGANADSSPLSPARSVATPDIVRARMALDTQNTPYPGQDSESSPEKASRVRSALVAAEFLDRVSHGTEILLAPMGLALVIEIPKETFAASFATGGTAMDIKIDVFVNGELAESTVCAAPRLNGDCMQLVINGRRISRGMNRPWIIVPAAQNAEGNLLEVSVRKYSAPEVRWRAIADMLAVESDLRGFDEVGNRSPTGEYLRTLSQMDMPDEINDMQNSNPMVFSRFGVVDVVLTFGARMPLAVPKWSYEPGRLEDPRHRLPETAARSEYEPTTSDAIASQQQDMNITETRPNPAASANERQSDDAEMKDTSTNEAPTAQSLVMAPPTAPTASTRNPMKRRRSDAISSDYSESSSQAASYGGSRTEELVGISRRGVIRRGSRASLHEADSAGSQGAPMTPNQGQTPLNVRSVTFSLGEKVVAQTSLSQPHLVFRTRGSPMSASPARASFVLPLVSLPTLKSFDLPATPMAIPKTSVLQSSPAETLHAPMMISKPTFPIKSSPTKQSSSPTKQSSPTKSPSAKAKPNVRIPTATPARSDGATAAATPAITTSANLTWAPASLTKNSLVSYALPGPYIKGIAEGCKSIIGGVNVDGSPCGVYRPMRVTRVAAFEEAEVLAGFRFLVG